MSKTMNPFAAAAKKAVLVGGLAVSLTALGCAVAAADSTGEGQTGAIYNSSGTQGEWRQGSQGTTNTSGIQGELRSGTAWNSGSLGTPNGGGQKVADDDGFQGAYAYGSTIAFPQYR